MSLPKLIDCTTCASNNLAIINLKKWNAITIGCCCILGFSGLSLSAYLLCKYLKLKRTVNSLQAKIQNLTTQINNSLKVDNKSILIQTASNKENSVKKVKKLQFKQNASILSSDNDESSSVEDDYETPDELQSPTQKEPKQLERKTSINSFDLNLNDNRSLELMQMQTYENKMIICSNNKCKYENNPNDLNDCINYIKSMYVLSDSENDIETKKSLQFEAHNIAKKCVELYPDSYLPQKWFALTVGKIVEFLSINEKIKSGFEFKERLDKAIILNESDYLLYYLRGRWFFKMCNLSWAETYGIRLLFGKIPQISLDDAYKDFLRVEELHKNKSKGSILHLAKCLIHKKEIKRAIEYLKIACELPARTTEHKADDKEILSLLDKYS